MPKVRILLLLLFLPFYLFAQNNYAFQHLTVEDGLASNFKTGIFQDREGFYWFINENGVQRFDGKNFINYKFNYDSSKTPQAEYWLYDPVEDSEKNIWIINNEGINIFNRKKEKFLRLYMNDAADSNMNNVSALLKDNKNTLWIVTQKNIYYYNYTLHKPVLFSEIFQNNNAGINAAQYDVINDCIWLLTSNAKKIKCFSLKYKRIIFTLDGSAIPLLAINNPISFFKLDKSENLWIATYGGDFCRYNIPSGKTISYNILHTQNNKTVGSPNSTIVGAIDDGNGFVWFGCDYHLGLLRYNKSADSFDNLENDNGSEYGFHYNEIVYNFFQDNEKNIWIDTDLGMNVFNPQGQVFKYLTPKAGSLITQFSADISSIFQSSCGDIWVSTWGDGIFQYDKNFQLRHHYIHNKDDASSFGEPLNRAWCFAEDKKGRLWIGCQYGMLCMFDTASKKFSNKKIDAFNNSTIMHEIKTNDGIWFGLFGGLIAKLDEFSGKIIVYHNAYRNPLGQVSSVDGICADYSENIWWSPGANGLRKFDVQKNYVIDSILTPLHISSPKFINDTLLIAGTDTKGLLMYNFKNKSAQFYNTSNGLSTNDVFGAVTSSGNKVWIIAKDGIKLLDLTNKKIHDFNISNGIKDRELQGPFYQLKDGTILIAANSGIVYFNPDVIKMNAAPPDVTVTDFMINNKSYAVDSLLANKKINLSYKQNVVSIGYGSLSFNGRTNNQYYYQLSGVDKDWINAGTQRFVTYANLSPGDYTFKIKAQNADGINTKNITSITLEINEPWWQTWWAYLIWATMAAFIIYIIYNYRKQNQAVLAEVRQRIATDLHDDIGSTLNSISVYSEIANNQFERNPANAKKLLYKMGEASRNMIDNMNDIVWAVNPKNDQFENVLQRMQYFAGELLSGKNILLEFYADESLKNIKMPMANRKNFYLIFKEVINNAYKYSESKMVNVKIVSHNSELEMMIKDEGKGFDISNHNVNGNGLKNMELRAKEIQGRLNIESNKKGTTVYLRIPVK